MSEAIICGRCEFFPGDKIDRVFTVQKRLGEGTYGCVYCVVDSTGNRLALKLLKLWEVQAQERPELLKRFDMEYETGRIDSKYLVHSLDKGIVEGNPYIVMEFCSGGDLMAAAEQHNVDFRRVGRQILYGLRDLHARGKVHRDLKPENVLLRADQTAVLTDFGISGDQNKRLTQRGIFGVPQQRFGTFAYMPPEQVNPKRGNATVLPTTDIFSYGVMMYQLLSGELPFGDLESESDLPRYVQRGKIGDWNRSLLENSAEGREWVPLIEGCLQPDYKERLQNIDDCLVLMPQSKQISQSLYEAPKPIDIGQNATNGYLLRIMQGEEYGRTYRLDEIARQRCVSLLTIGRDSEDVYNAIAIKETMTCYISRCHATLEQDLQYRGWVIRNGQWRINCHIGRKSPQAFPCATCTARCTEEKDRQFSWVNSLNGTHVGSSEVGPNGFLLQIGDIITLGDTKLRVEGY